eukprot:5807538-Prymnesium_polylepis.1
MDGWATSAGWAWLDGRAVLLRGPWPMMRHKAVLGRYSAPGCLCGSGTWYATLREEKMRGLNRVERARGWRGEKCDRQCGRERLHVHVVQTAQSVVAESVVVALAGYVKYAAPVLAGVH